MNGRDIDFFLKHVRDYGGVVDLHHLSNIKPGYVYVVFTGISPHGHWVVLDLKNNFFFDSFGKSPLSYGLPHMNYNKQIIQHSSSDVCGLYCLYFLLNGVKGLKRFSSDTKQNDRWLLKWLSSAVFK